MQSYLNDRTQTVMIGEIIGGRFVINIGVGQGTVLGPTLFKIYIMDLHPCFVANLQMIQVLRHLVIAKMRWRPPATENCKRLTHGLPTTGSDYTLKRADTWFTVKTS